MIFEKYEISTSGDGITYSPFSEFLFGQKRQLDKFVKFRVTVWGDFEPFEYRFRGFSGIVDDATFTIGGFGISPFGRFPFGDGGVCEESFSVSGSGIGEIALSGNLSSVVT